MNNLVLKIFAISLFFFLFLKQLHNVIFCILQLSFILIFAAIFLNNDVCFDVNES